MVTKNVDTLNPGRTGNKRNSSPGVLKRAEDQLEKPQTHNVSAREESKQQPGPSSAGQMRDLLDPSLQGPGASWNPTPHTPDKGIPKPLQQSRSAAGYICKNKNQPDSTDCKCAWNSFCKTKGTFRDNVGKRE